MIAHLRYARYLARHKWFVLLAGLRVRAPLWRLIIHDWSKFRPCEWRPYAAYFYGGELHPSDIEGKAARKNAFDRAWLAHQHANPHHWQHWLLRLDDGGTQILEMPEHFVREMVADWMGAGRAITGRWEVGEWYAKNRQNITLHSETKRLVGHLIARYGTAMAP